MKHALSALVVVLCAFVALAARAQPFEEGKQYRTLEAAQPATSDGKVEVVEFFYYGCPVCYEAQPHVTRWLSKQGERVRFRRVPAASNEAWAAFARTYYALEAVGELDRLHWPLYDNHHFDGRQLNEEPKLLAWLSANGVDAERFRAARNSNAVGAKVAEAKALLERYGVKRVPSFVVGGKYVTSAVEAGGVPEMMQVVDFLVGRAAK